MSLKELRYGSPAEQEIAVEARHAPPLVFPHKPADRDRANDGRSALAPSHQSQRLLSRQEGRQDQERVDFIWPQWPDRVGSGPGIERSRNRFASSLMEITVAIDCMGGDHGPHVTVPAALNFLKSNSDVDIVLVGLRDAIEAELKARGAKPGPRLRVHHASEVVLMDESPALALRNKKDSSIRVAAELAKTGEAHACVSAGNTGALMAISRFVLKMLPGIDRPAIASVLPNMRRTNTYVLDLGANVDCTPENLLQFGIMGAMLVAAVEHKERPSVGLLNIGVEDIKGNETVKHAADLLRCSGLNFAGNVEGDDIYKGGVDVVVCDGFVGNVALKASEGVLQMMASALREEFSRNPFTRLAALAALPVIRAFRRRMDHRRYNGASLLGLRGIVIKSHGAADLFAFGQALERAVDEVRNSVPQRINARMPQLQVPAA